MDMTGSESFFKVLLIRQRLRFRERCSRRECTRCGKNAPPFFIPIPIVPLRKTVLAILYRCTCLSGGNLFSTEAQPWLPIQGRTSATVRIMTESTGSPLTETRKRFLLRKAFAESAVSRLTRLLNIRTPYLLVLTTSFQLTGVGILPTWTTCSLLTGSATERKQINLCFRSLKAKSKDRHQKQ